MARSSHAEKSQPARADRQGRKAPDSSRRGCPAFDAPPSGRPGALGTVLTAAAAAVVFLTAFHSLQDVDIFFHLRGGMEIVTTGTIPRLDTWSYPSEGRPYLDLHWLFQVIVYGVHQAAGERGLIVFATATVFATFALLYRLARRSLPAGPAAALTVCGAIVSSERFFPRPELLTFFFLALAAWLLQRHREGSPRAAWWLVPLTVLWVNTEGLFILLFAVLGAHVLDRIRDKRLWTVAGLCAVASLANPYFVEGALHPFILFTRINQSIPIYSETIGEFFGPFEREALHPSVLLLPVYLALLGAALVALVVPPHARRPRPGELILVAAFVWLALSARRNVALLPIAATPVLARWIGEIARKPAIAGRLASAGERAQRGSAGIAAAVALVLMAAYGLALVNGCIYRHAQVPTRTGFATPEIDFPREGAEYLRRNRIGGPIFATFGAGSFLTWAYPQEKVFIDGRLEVHTAEHYERYLLALRGGPAWEQVEAQYGFNAILLEPLLSVDLTQRLLRDPRWAPVHLDPQAMVLVRRTDANAALIDRDAITPARLREQWPVVTAESAGEATQVPPPRGRSPWFLCFTREPFPWRNTQLGQFFLALGRPDLALGQLIEAVRRDPAAIAPRVTAAAALQNIGRTQDAARLLEDVANRLSTREEAGMFWTVRGDVHRSMEQPREAVEAFTRALEAPVGERQVPSVLANRGFARLLTGDAEGAAADVQASLRLDPRGVQAWFYLGRIEEARGRNAQAIEAYGRARSLGGPIPEVEAALKRLGAAPAQP